MTSCCSKSKGKKTLHAEIEWELQSQKFIILSVCLVTLHITIKNIFLLFNLINTNIMEYVVALQERSLLHKILKGTYLLFKVNCLWEKKFSLIGLYI